MFLRGLDPSGTRDRDGNARSILSFQEGTRKFQDIYPYRNGLYSYGDSQGTNTNETLGTDPIANQNEQHYLGVAQWIATNLYTPGNVSGNDSISVVRPKNAAVNYIIKAYYIQKGYTVPSRGDLTLLDGGTYANINYGGRYMSKMDGDNTESFFQYQNIGGVPNAVVGVQSVSSTGSYSWKDWYFNANNGTITTPNNNILPEIINTTGATGRPVIQSFTFSAPGSGSMFQTTFPQAFLPGTIPQVWVQTCYETPNGLGRAATINITANAGSSTTPNITNTGFVWGDTVLGGGGCYGSGMAVTAQILAIGYM